MLPATLRIAPYVPYLDTVLWLWRTLLRCVLLPQIRSKMFAPVVGLGIASMRPQSTNQFPPTGMHPTGRPQSSGQLWPVPASFVSARSPTGRLASPPRASPPSARWLARPNTWRQLGEDSLFLS